MEGKEQAEVAQLKEQGDVKKALRQTPTRKPNSSKPAIKTTHKTWLGSYVLILLGLAGVYYLLRLRLFGFAAKYVPLLQRFTLGAMAIVLVLASAKLID